MGSLNPSMKLITTTTTKTNNIYISSNLNYQQQEPKPGGYRHSNAKAHVNMPIEQKKQQHKTKI